MAQVLAYHSRNKDRIINAITTMQGNPREAGLLGYLAGILDGEGTIGIKKYLPKGENRNMCYYLYLSMGMQHKPIPDLFKEVFGGTVSEDRVLHRASMWRWNATGKIHIAAILNALIPYLIVKKEQAELALSCCNSWSLQDKTGRNFNPTTDEELLKREEAYQLMRKLKHQEHPQRPNETTLETVK